MRVSFERGGTFARSTDRVKAQDFHFAFRFGIMRAPSSCGHIPKQDGSKKPASQGIDGPEKPCMMCGSLGRK
jgi:hypothetical protein